MEKVEETRKSLTKTKELIAENGRERKKKLTVPRALAFIKKYKEPDFPETKYIKPELFILNHTHVNYCEALIDVEGRIAYAIPSHKSAVFGSARTRVLYELKTDIADFSIEGCATDFKKVLVWYDYCIIGFTDAYA